MKKTYELDPHQKFRTLSEINMLMLLGSVPEWAFNEDFKEFSAVNALKKQYQYPYGSMTGKVSKDGIYKFPGDMPLYPLIKIERGAELIFQYNFGIIAVIDKDSNTSIFRMD